jgi:hypothetical protein
MKSILTAVSVLRVSGFLIASVALPAIETQGVAVLSSEGSGRATAYAEQHKIISLGDKRHVVWLDADESRFLVRGRTWNESDQRWSEVVTIGEAQDNHGGPSLTCDSKGYLHIVYYPHHDAVRYRVSVRPNDLSAWSDEVQFGEGLSYPTMVCSPDDTLILTARRGYFHASGDYIDAQHLEQELWTKRIGEAWQRKSTLMRSRFPRYAQFATSLAWSRDGQILHLSARIYETDPRAGAEPLTTVAYMKSSDGGATWTASNGRRIALPATAASMDIVARSEDGNRPLLNVGPLAVSRTNIPHIAYTARSDEGHKLFLAVNRGMDGWSSRELTAAFPETLREWAVDLGMGGGLSFSDSGYGTLLAVALRPSDHERGTVKEWGHPTTEVLRVGSDDEFATFDAAIMTEINAAEPHWLVNIERPAGHNRVPDQPGIVYTAGVAGAGLKDLKLENRVVWQVSAGR